MVDASDIADATGTPCLVDCTGFEKVDKSHGYAPRVVVGVAINVSICTWDIADHLLGAVASTTEAELWATGVGVVTGWPS
jgi:hypothetical protein